MQDLEGIIQPLQRHGLTYQRPAEKFKQHYISHCLRKTVNLKHVSLDRSIIVMLCEALVLQQFNYCDNVYNSCIDN